MQPFQRTNLDVKACVAVRTRANCLLAIAIVTNFWAVLWGAKIDRPVLPLMLSLVPVVLLFVGHRLATTPLTCWLSLGTTALVVFGATYIYLDAFLVNYASINSGLLLQVPAVQIVTALILLAFVTLRGRGRRLSASDS